MADLYTCTSCGRQYRADKLSSCPGCSEEPTLPIPLFESQNSSFGQDLDIGALIEAQNRTTHAVRALAVIFFWSLFWTGVVSLLLIFASLFQTGEDCSSGFCVPVANPFSTFVVFIAAITGIVGYIITLRSGIKEIRQSRIYQTWF